MNKKMSSFLLAAGILLLLLCLWGCSLRPAEEEALTEIVFDAGLIQFAGMTCEEFYEDLSAVEAGCQELQIQGDTVVMTITQRQQEEWKKHYRKLAEDTAAEYGKLPDSRIILQDELSGFDIYINPDNSYDEVMYYLVSEEYYCTAYRLIFLADGSRSIEICVYNADTGKLVVRGDENELTMTTDDWIRSYQ